MQESSVNMDKKHRNNSSIKKKLSPEKGNASYKTLSYLDKALEILKLLTRGNLKMNSTHFIALQKSQDALWILSNRKPIC